MLQARFVYDCTRSTDRLIPTLLPVGAWVFFQLGDLYDAVIFEIDDVTWDELLPDVVCLNVSPLDDQDDEAVTELVRLWRKGSASCAPFEPHQPRR